MIQLIYVSSAKRKMKQGDLLDLLQVSRSNNKRLDVTGVLVYRNGAFLQVLEGQEQAVERLYERICADERHKDVTTLMKEPADRRDFPDWAMGFRGLGDLRRANVPGFSPFADEETIVERLSDKPGPARETVRRFFEVDT